MSAESKWREIAKELAQALAAVPNEHVWRDYAEGVSAARHAVDFWRDEVETIGERWHAAEQAAEKGDQEPELPDDEQARRPLITG